MAEAIKIKRLTVIAAVFIIFIITYASFYPSLCNGFTNWDDNKYVTDNPAIRELSWPGVKNIFTSLHQHSYYPVALLSYAVEYHFFGLEEPFVFHATNLALHILNALLVFWLFYLISGRIPVPFVTAILFAIHPMHVESVAWISERRDVLYTFFFLLSVICYEYYASKPKGRPYYHLSIIFFILSMMSKAIAVVLPFTLLLFDYLRGRRFNRKLFIEKIPFFAIAAVFSFAVFHVFYSLGDIREKEVFDLFANIPIALYGVFFYLEKLVFPVNLSSFYPYPGDIAYISGYVAVTAVPLLLILTSLVILSLRFTRKVAFGVLFFIVTILPVIQLLPSGRQMPADRYTYVPFLGLFYIFAEGFSYLYYNKPRHKKILLIFFSVITLVLSSLTWQRCLVWKNSETLWSDVLKKYPNAIACNSLGDAYCANGEIDLAIMQYSQAISIDPTYIKAFMNRGNARYIKKEYDKALADFSAIIAIDPGYYKAYDGCGISRASMGLLKEALADFNKAISINPDYSNAYHNRAFLYMTTKQYDLAKDDLRKAKSLGQNDTEKIFSVPLYSQ